MRLDIRRILLAGAAGALLAGCAVRLCPEDRLLLTQAIDASRNAAGQCARQDAAQGQSVRPAQAAGAVAGPGQVQEMAPAAAAQLAEAAAERAELAAERAELAAEAARKFFDSGLRK